MTKSKLEVYEDVLKILTNSFMTLDAIAFAGNMDCQLLSKKIDQLMDYGLVEKTTCKQKSVYSLTSRGEAIFKTLTLTKRLKKLQASIVSAPVETESVQAYQGEAWKTKRKL